MFYYELKKIILKKRSLILAGILLVFQCFLFLMWSESSSIEPDVYKQMQTEIKTMNLDEAEHTIRLQLEQEKNHDMSSYEKDHEETLKRVLLEIEQIKDYPEFFQNIIHDKGLHEEISIFSENDDFTRKLHDAIQSHYLEKQITAGSSSQGSYAVEQILNYPFIDIVILLLSVYFISIQIDHDKDLGTLDYFRSMCKGRCKNYLNRYASIAISIIVFMVISYALIYLISSTQYGFVDLNAPVQSIPYCGTVPSSMNILQFLMMALAMRCMIVIILLTVLYSLSFLIGRTMLGTMLFLLLLFAGNAAASISADTYSIAKLLSMTQLLHPEIMYIHVTYVAFFHQAVFFPYVYIVLALISILLFTLAFHSFSRGKHKEFKMKFTIRDKTYHSLLYYEIIKSWGSGLGLISAMILLTMIGNHIDSIKTLSNSNDRMIAYYIDQLGVSPTRTTYLNIEQEKERYSEIYDQLNETKDEDEVRRLQTLLNKEQAFLEYCERMDHLQYDTDRKVLKEDQTRMFFEQRDFYSQILAVYMVIIILLSMHSYDKEQQSGVEVIQKITNKGSMELFRYKAISITSLLILTWSTGNMIILVFTMKLYPDLSWSSSMNDLQQLFDFPFRISIASYLILQFLLQLVITAMLVYCTLYLFSKTIYKKQIAMILILLFPLILLIENILRRPYIITLFYPFMNITRFFIAFIIVTSAFIYCFIQRRKEYHHA